VKVVIALFVGVAVRAATAGVAVEVFAAVDVAVLGTS